jgi:hypothetical protein
MLRFQKVSDNLYRGSAPEEFDIPILKSKYGITKIISLDKKSGERISDSCKKYGIKQIIIPIHGSKGLDIFSIKNATEKLIGNDIAYVHCHHGKDRTGLFVAKYRTDNGWDCKKALNEALSFGFGTYMKDKNIVKFIKAIGCKDINIDNILSIIKKNEHNLCAQCGMVKHNNICNNCMIMEALLSMSKIIKFADSQEGVDKKLNTIVDEQKESPYSYQLIPDQPMQGINSVSNMFSADATTSSIPNIPALEVPTMLGLANIKMPIRKAFIKKILKNAVSQQLSYEIPKSEKKIISNCIDLLQDLLDSEIEIYKDHLDAMYKPFKDHEGINTEQAENVQSYFDMYSSKLNEYLKNLKIKVLRIVKSLQNFESDTDISSMLKSLDKLLDNLKLYQEMLDKLLSQEKTNDFQKNIVKSIELSKKEIAQLKQLITERIIPYLNKNILGNNWSSDIQNDIIDDIKEQKIEEELNDSEI